MLDAQVKPPGPPPITIASKCLPLVAVAMNRTWREIEDEIEGNNGRTLQNEVRGRTSIGGTGQKWRWIRERMKRRQDRRRERF